MNRLWLVLGVAMAVMATAISYALDADLVGAINILRAGHAHCACEVSGAAMPPAAGTHRSDSFRLDAGVGAVGIPQL